MPTVSFSAMGSKGLSFDLSPSELPLDVWTGGKNVRFTPAGVARTYGNESVFGTAAAEPLSAFYTIFNGAAVWCYFSTTDAYSTDGATHYNITRAGGGYSPNLQRKYNGGNFNGLVVANNGVDVPQVWIPTSIDTRLVNLPNWPADLRCRVLRPFRNFLVALDLTDSASSRPTSLRWSHPADPGSVPVSWDISDSTKDAGEVALSETAGEIVDLVHLHNDALVYKTDSIYRMQYTGGTFIFTLQKAATGVGMPTTNCAVEIRPGVHVFWTGDDIVQFDGQSMQSIAEGKIRRLVSGISDDVYRACFMVKNTEKSEAWFCFPEDQSNPNRVTKAVIYNWITGAWGVKDFDNGYNAIVRGPVSLSAVDVDVWNARSGSWLSAASMWGEVKRSRSTPRLLGLTASGFVQEDAGKTVNGLDYQSYVERVAIGIPFKQGLPPDISSQKFCREIWPRVTGDSGTELEVTLGLMDRVDGPVTWLTPKVFRVGVDRKVNVTATGRMFALRFGSRTQGNWTLHGYDLVVQPAGGY